MTRTLAEQGLQNLAAALATAGYTVMAPLRLPGRTGLRDDVRWAEWTPGSTIDTDRVPVDSPKEFLLPRSEVVGGFRRNGDAFEALDTAEAPRNTVILGARPCDAAALAALDAVFNSDPVDVAWQARRNSTTVVTLACAQCDSQCFCTSVGGSPGSDRGADVMLRPADGHTVLQFETLSDKGRAVEQVVAHLLADRESRPDPLPEVPVLFDVEVVQRAARAQFDSDIWATLSLPCLGCGACAYACPTCHCFDIQDECDGKDCVRLRNWDSCGFGLFTRHAGGHNPRADQASRWRQRVMHKFAYFPERHDITACTGCGRCARVCSAGMRISAVCAALGEVYTQSGQALSSAEVLSGNGVASNSKTGLTSEAVSR